MGDHDLNSTTLDLAVDLENWMGNLPAKLKTQPVIQLAIPGSHDSFTWKITPNSGIAPDAEDIVKALSHLGPIVSIILANWSITQALPAADQLKSGIRYFDIRISTKDKSDDLFIVHSLYSTKAFPIYDEINEFLNAHPQEIVILDHQHFYDCDENDHKKLIEKLEKTFGDKLLPCNNIYNMNSITLANMYEKKYQVIVPYRQEKIASSNNKLWPTRYFPTPWPNTTNETNLFRILDNGLKIRDPKFAYVSQCVLTPDAQFILGNLTSSLKEKCATDLEEARTNWISKQTPGPGGVNIFIADFIDLSDNKFAKTVINLNMKIAHA